MFGSIGKIVQHPGGTVFIADTQVPVFRRYDTEGVFLHDVGRRGQGPGEYESIMSLKLTLDGNLAIWDTRSRRVSIVHPDGSFVSSFCVDGFQEPREPGG